MNALTFGLSCPHCGAPVEPLARGGTNGHHTSMIVRCTTCVSEHQIVVTLTTTRPPRRRAA